MKEPLSPLRWDGTVLSLLDQRLLPGEEKWVDCRDEHDVAMAIREMIVRGAPAIGCAAAFGVALAGLHVSGADAPRRIEAAIELLRATRPTAVNLSWALDKMRAVAGGQSGAEPGSKVPPPPHRGWGGPYHAPLTVAGSPAPQSELAAVLAETAEAIWRDDIDRCKRIGAAGEALVPDGATVLTHCNAGALATGGYGTALGVIRAARDAGKRVRVLADETRPFLQGARLTAWELHRDGIDVTIIPDAAAASLLRTGEVACVIVGADRIAANGDTANKIGTYPLALAAAAHEVPFYVAAPLSSIDPACPDGDHIPIEERPAAEVTHLAGALVAPAGVPARNPAFDVTPARLIAAMITERGLFRPPYNFMIGFADSANGPT